MGNRTTGMVFSILSVQCRHCGAGIEVEVPTDISPDAQLAECERQSEEKHSCQRRPLAPAPIEPAANA
jgi:hypothetical protein